MIDIFDKLNAAYGDKTLADSDQIKDKKFGKKQDVLNKEILDPDDPNSLKSKVDSFNGIVIDPDNVVSTDKSDIEVGSSKIPTGNAVAGALSDAVLKAGVFDISAYNLTNDQPTPYADLEAALGNNGENVPEAVRKGGMQVKFIQGSVGSSDNKYVQARCMAQSFTTDVTQWQGVDEVLIAGSKNLAESGVVAEVIDVINCEIEPLFQQRENSGYLGETGLQVNTDFTWIQIAVSPNAKVTIKANPNTPCVYALLKNKITIYNQVVDLSTNFGSNTDSCTTLHGTSNITLGADTNYIAFRSKRFSQSKNYLPAVLTVNGVDYLKKLKEVIGEVKKETELHKTDIDDYKYTNGKNIGLIPSLLPISGFFDYSNVSIVASDTSKYYLIPISGGNKVSIKANNIRFVYAFLKDEPIFNGETIDLTNHLCDDTTVYGVNANKTVSKIIPDDALFMICDVMRIPAYLKIGEADYSKNLVENLVNYGMWFEKEKQYSYLDNAVWAQWITPMIDACNQEHNRIYFGWTNNIGEKGVGFVNQENGFAYRFTFGKSEIDDHSAVAVKVLNSNYILCAWSAHNEEPYLHIRRSSVVEDIDNWLDEITIEVMPNATYAQIIQRASDDRIYIFFRCQQARDWYYVYSDTDGTTWSTPIPFIRSSSQYYLIVRKSTDENIFNVACYANPSLAGNSTDIRAAYWDSVNDKMYDDNDQEIAKIYDSDYPEQYQSGETLPFWTWTNIPIKISRKVDGVDTFRLRLHDLAITAPGVFRILYNDSPDDRSAELQPDSMKYYVYDNGNTIFVSNCGLPFYTASRYTGGGNFNPVDNNELYISRNIQGVYKIDKWRIDNNSITLVNNLFKSKQGKLAVRPKVSLDGKDVGFWYGSMNPSDFREFDTKIKFLKD